MATTKERGADSSASTPESEAQVSDPTSVTASTPPTSEVFLAPETIDFAFTVANTNADAESSKANKSRKSKKSSTDLAIESIKNLLRLKVEAQKVRTQFLAIKESVQRLFSDDDISEEDATKLLSEIDILGKHVHSRREYLAAREAAKPALALLEEAGLTEEEAAELQ